MQRPAAWLQNDDEQQTLDPLQVIPSLDEEDNEKDKDEKPAFSPIEKELLDDRTILVNGPVDDKMSAGLTARLLVLEKRDPKGLITLWINSPGGSADSGFAMYDMLKFIACPIRTIVSGLCASAGILIALGGDAKQRFSMPGSRFMLHQPSTAGQGQASDLDITAKEIVKMRARYVQIVAQSSGKDEKDVVNDLSRDFWLSPVEAKEYGMIAKIIEKRTDLPKK